jgi:hypothetical protein
MNRIGLGKGKGSGYYNLLSRDKVIHAQSAKGIRQPQYVGTYGRVIRNPRRLVEELKNADIRNIKVKGGRVSMIFNGKPVSNPIKLNNKVGNIANWGHSLTDNKVFIDKDAPYKKQLAVHEAVEQHVGEKYGLKYAESHEVAEHWERKFADSQGIDWQKSQQAIFKTKI